MKREIFERNPILQLSFEFAVAVVAYCESLETERKYVVSRQLLRSGTSVGANAMEAQNAESKADFIHKMKLAAKEAGETQYWLMICELSPGYPDCKMLVEKLEPINKILNSILSTSKKKQL